MLDAALKVFAGKGLSATKISDIAREAELSHGLIYHYFSSKEDIFTELVKEALAYSNRAYQQAGKVEGGPLAKLRALMDNFIEDSYSGKGVYLFLLIIEASTSDNVPEEVKQLMADKESYNKQFLLPLFRQGQEEGQIISKDPAKLAYLFSAIIKGLALVYPEANKEGAFPDTELIINAFRA